MKKLLHNHLQFLLMAGFAGWIFISWRLAGMPDPGFSGRFIPVAWFFAALLNGSKKLSKSFIPMVISYSAGVWLWMLNPSVWVIVAAIPVAGLIVWSFSIADKSGFGIFRAILPVLFLSLITAEVNGDEVRFAEQAAVISRVSNSRFSVTHFRPGDISSTQGHHTPVFPFLISPGLHIGDTGLRIIPVIVSLLAIFALAKLTNPKIAVAAALLYPGFAILGLAMTGWMAAGLFTLAVLLPEGKKWLTVRFLIALLLVALKIRYIGLAAGILLAEYACIPKSKNKWIVPIIGIFSTALVLVVDRYLLNGMLFWSRYGNIEAVNLIWTNTFHRPIETLTHAGWSLFDPEAGLFFRAPWVLASIPGLFLYHKKSPIRFKKLFIPAFLYWAFLIVWSGSSWHGLPAPVGRMFVPMLPLFASGLLMVWNKKETRILIVLSIAVSALVVVWPVCRYNFADGTDTLLSIFGITTGFSMVRSYSYQLLIAGFLALSTMLVIGKSQKYSGMMFVLILSIVFFLSLSPSGYEAEDLTPDMVQGARLYPYSSDPVERFFWFNSRERMLELAEAGQSVLMPNVEAGDTLVLQMSSKEAELLVGNQLIQVASELIELPSVYRDIGRSVRVLPDRPENRLMMEYSILVDSTDVSNQSIRITHNSGSPVYIDRIRCLDSL